MKCHLSARHVLASNAIPTSPILLDGVLLCKKVAAIAVVCVEIEFTLRRVELSFSHVYVYPSSSNMSFCKSQPPACGSNSAHLTVKYALSGKALRLAKLKLIRLTLASVYIAPTL